MIPLPDDIDIRPAPGGSMPRQRLFLGAWGGDAWGDVLPTMLVVEAIGTNDTADVVYAIGHSPWVPNSPQSTRARGRFEGHELLVDFGTARTRWRLLADGRLFGRYEGGGMVSYCVLRRIEGGIDAIRAAAADTGARCHGRAIDIPMTDPDSGAPIGLKATYTPSPQIQCPPLVLINHGSADGTPREEIASRVIRHGQLSRFFVGLGWAVLEPMRRGRGGSGGRYVEQDFDHAPTVDSSEAELAAGLADLRAAMDFVRSWPEVDGRRVLLAGQSRGGFLATMYEAAHPGEALGVLDFAGGWWSEAWERDHLGGGWQTGRFATAGATSRALSLWLYGTIDDYYGPDIVESWHRAYAAAGARTALRLFETPKDSGHHIVAMPGFWEADATAFVASLS